MLNPYTVKRWMAVLQATLLGTVGYVVTAYFYGPVYAVGGFAIALLLTLFIGGMLLRSPFTDMLEGKGILVFNMDSTGIITPFIVKINSPFLKGRVQGKEVKDIFDREAVYQLAQPEKSTTAAEIRPDGLHISLTQTAYNEGRFALHTWPVLIYNHQIGSIVTKSFLATKEHEAFAKHGILYLNRKVEDLTSYVRDFARHVIETLKPRGEGWLTSKWGIIIMVAGIGLLLLLFAPAIMDGISGFIGRGTETLSQSTGTASGAVKIG